MSQADETAQTGAGSSSRLGLMLIGGGFFALFLTGLLLSEEGDALVLADAEGKPQRIPSAEVEERTTAPLSPMPANFAERIPEDEFHRLLAYLLSQRAPDAAEE